MIESKTGIKIVLKWWNVLKNIPSYSKDNAGTMQSECMETFPLSRVKYIVDSWAGLEFCHLKPWFFRLFCHLDGSLCAALSVESDTARHNQDRMHQIHCGSLGCIRLARSTQTYLLVPDRRCRNLYASKFSQILFFTVITKEEKNVLVTCGNRQGCS